MDRSSIAARSSLGSKEEGPSSDGDKTKHSSRDRGSIIGILSTGFLGGFLSGLLAIVLTLFKDDEVSIDKDLSTVTEGQGGNLFNLGLVLQTTVFTLISSITEDHGGADQ